MMLMKVFVFIAFLSFSKSKTNFMPNLPVGEYRIVFERTYPCESTNLIQYNLYFSQKTSSITEMKGNFTFKIPMDDNFTLDVNSASWDSTGGWKPNSMVYISKNACSSLKNVLGNVWHVFAKAFNFLSARCPVQVGTYITSGVDLENLKDHNFLKVYFYRKNKMVVKIKNKENKILGCGVMELSLIRPWETPT